MMKRRKGSRKHIILALMLCMCMLLTTAGDMTLLLAAEGDQVAQEESEPTPEVVSENENDVEITPENTGADENPDGDVTDNADETPEGGNEQDQPQVDQAGNPETPSAGESTPPATETTEIPEDNTLTPPVDQDTEDATDPKDNITDDTLQGDDTLTDDALEGNKDEITDTDPENKDEIIDPEDKEEKEDKEEITDPEEKDPEEEATYKTDFEAGADGDRKITAHASEEAQFPENTEIKIQALADESEVKAAVEGYCEGKELLGSAAFDIRFEADGETVEPAEGTVTVTIEFASPILPVEDPENVSYGVLHLTEGGTELVGNDEDVIRDENGVTSVTFTSGSFSPFVIFAAGEKDTSGEIVTMDLDEPKEVPSADLSYLADGGIDGITVEASMTEGASSFTVELSYVIHDHFAEAKRLIDEGKAWEFDLSALTKDERILRICVDENNNTGILRDEKGNPRGTYVIKDGKVELRPDRTWLDDIKAEDGVKGKFSFSAELNKDKIGEGGGLRFQFAEGKEFEVTVNTDTTTHDKDVFVDSNGDIPANGGSVQLIADAGGNYYLYYKLTITPGEPLDNLWVQDDLGEWQTLDTSSVTVSDTYSGNSKQQVDVDYDKEAHSFKLRLAGYSSVFGNVDAKHTYEVRYRTIVDPEAVERELAVDNNARWYGAEDKPYGDKPDTTTVHPSVRGKLLDKTVREKAQLDEKNGCWYYTYEVTVGDGKTDLAGYTLKDWTDWQHWDFDKDSFRIYIKEGDGKKDPEELADVKPNIEDFNAPGGQHGRFTFQFPDNGKKYYGPYTFEYRIYIDGSYGTRTFVNTACLEPKEGQGDPIEARVENTETFTPGHFLFQKSYSEWKGNGTVEWMLSLFLDKGDTAEDVKLTEVAPKYIFLGKDVIDTSTAPAEQVYEEYSDSENKDKGDLDILWDQTRVLDKKGNTLEMGTDYTIDEAKKTITINSVDEMVFVYLTTKSPVPLDKDDGSTFWFYNQATATLDGTEHHAESCTSYENRKREPGYVPVNKELTSYDKKTGVAEWTVYVNQEKKDLDPFDFYFVDDLPEGMEYLGYDGYKGQLLVMYDNSGSWVSWWEGIGFTVRNIADGDGHTHQRLQTIDTIGLKEHSYAFRYQTKVDPNAPEIGKSKTFSNVGGVKRAPDGGYWGEDTANVEVSSYGVFKNANLIDSDIIRYTVEIKLPEDAVSDDTLESVTMEDVLTEEVELIVSTVKVTDPDGKPKSEGTDYEYAYDPATRKLTVTLYDKNPCKVCYEVKVVDTDDKPQEISNEVTVFAKDTYTDAVKGEYLISSHSGSISGLQPGKITIRKQDTKGNGLPGARFELEKWNGSKWEPVTGSPFVTGDGGTAEIKNLWTNPQVGKYSETYRYREIEAPEGYKISDESYHCFILYMKDEKDEIGSREAANAEAAKRKEEVGAEVAAIAGGGEITVMDEKLLGALTIKKVVVGGNEAAKEKEFTFTITGPDGYKRTETLKGGESVTIKDLEPGGYTVKEDETGAAIEGYELKVTGEGSTVIGVKEDEVQNASVTVTNTYEPTPEESTTPETTPESTTPETTPESTTPETTPESTTPETTPESTTPETTPESTTPETTPEIVPEEGGGVLGERIAQIVQDLKEGVLGVRQGVLGVRTGDDAPIVGLSLAVLAAGAAIVLLVRKKKKEE